MDTGSNISLNIVLVSGELIIAEKNLLKIVIRGSAIIYNFQSFHLKPFLKV